MWIVDPCGIFMTKWKILGSFEWSTSSWTKNSNLKSLDYITAAADGDEPYTPPGLSDDDDDIADPGSKTPVYGGQNIAGEQQPTPVKDASVPGLEFNIDPTKSFFDTSAKPTKESKKSPEKSVKTPQAPAEPAKQFGLKIRSMASLQEVKKEAIEDLPVIELFVHTQTFVEFYLP